MGILGLNEIFAIYKTRLLNRNQFCGEVPNSLLAIRNIQILRLDNNYLDPVSKERIPFTLKMGIQLGFKKYVKVLFIFCVLIASSVRIVLRPQHSGVAPYKVVPEYSEFPPDVLHPSDHAAAQRYRAATTTTTASTLETLYDLPDNPHRWTPAEVSFWARVHGASRSVCESIRELGMTGGHFFRLVEADLQSALGVDDPRERAVLYSGMQRVLAVANGVMPPEYDGDDDDEDDDDDDDDEPDRNDVDHARMPDAPLRGRSPHSQSGREEAALGA
ncbi:hypothetical protein HDU83_003657 [Entophlyctis luteolus]|nr:hypothetical protein HDU83_003657 [Entophlyctis luteolus]